MKVSTFLGLSVLVAIAAAGVASLWPQAEVLMLIFCVGIVFSESVNKAFPTGSICFVVVGILVGVAARALLSASSPFAVLVGSQWGAGLGCVVLAVLISVLYAKYPRVSR